MTITIIIQELIPGRNTRENYWAYKKRRDRYEIEIMSQCRLRFKSKVTMSLTRYSSGTMDFDNLVSCGKPVIDAIKRAGIIVDDKMTIIGQPAYSQEKIARNEKPKYIVTITDL